MANRLTTEERIQRSKDIGIIVDPEYSFLLGLLSWNVSTKGYVETTYYVDGWRKQVKFHHFIVGTPVGDLQVDHINRNKLDNRLENLRIVNQATNILNRDYVDSAPNIRITKHNKYEVRISRNGYTHQIGTFANLIEAERARDNWYEIQSKNA